MQLNRFMWEDVEKGVFRKNKRIRTILKFDNGLLSLEAKVDSELNEKALVLKKSSFKYEFQVPESCDISKLNAKLPFFKEIIAELRLLMGFANLKLKFVPYPLFDQIDEQE